MITREEIRKGFSDCKTKQQKADYCKFHMEQERDMPELYENLVNGDGEKLFNFQGLFNSWSSSSPIDYVTMKYYGLSQRDYIMKYVTKTSKDKKSTEEMIEDVSVDVPNVREDDLSKVIGEMNEV
jgi:hypothetical protein